MPAMDILQKDASDGCIERQSLAELAEMFDVSVANLRGVKTYYSMYNKKPVGKYHLQVDTNIPAMLMGAEEIVAHLAQALGIEVGQSTEDGLFTLSCVEDLGSCGTCPVIQVNDRYYENMTVEKTDELLEQLRAGKMPDWPDQSNFDSKCDVLLKRRGKNDPSITGYIADGGYKSLDKGLAAKPKDIVAMVKESFLRGMGGAGFPTGAKWEFLPKDTAGKPIYLICNADEGEPGTFKDRQIMQYDPHLLIEGMVLAGYAIGAKMGFIYIRGEFAYIAEILETAISQAKEQGKLGSDIAGSGFNFDIVVHRGAGAYVCGEETALIESLEGKRGDPRLKPPFPAVEGLYGCPTIVNNVETLSSVPFIVGQGPDAYKKFGSSNNYGFKIFGVSGHVNRPGAYEFAMGTPLKDILDAAGGVKGKLKAVIVGGLSVPILTAAETKDLKMDFDSCLQADTMFGSGGIIVMNDTAEMPKIALRTIRFYKHESCGQCTPCREGTWFVEHLVRGLVEGRGSKGDIDRILDLCETVKGSTLCPTGDAYAMPIIAMIEKFRGEFVAGGQ